MNLARAGAARHACALTVAVVLMLAASPLITAPSAHAAQLAMSGGFRGSSAIWIGDPDTGALRRISPVSTDPGRGGSFEPAWSPRGGRIVFARSVDRFRSYHLWSVLPSGRGLRQLTRGRSINESPTWSPDGRRIAFTRLVFNRPGCFGSDLYLMQADGSRIYRLVRDANGISGRPAWSPDGSTIAFGAVRPRTQGERADLYRIDANGQNRRRIVNDATQPAWSPDGSRIAFVLGRGLASEIYSARPDGSDLRRLTNNRFYDQSPAWSPDGSRIAFASVRARGDQVYVMPAAGGPERIAVSRSGFVANSPAWRWR